MDIYPQDLGLKSYVKLLRLRAQATGAVGYSVMDDPGTPQPITLTKRQRLSLQDTDVDEQTARYAKPVFDLYVNDLPPALIGGAAITVGYVFALFSGSASEAITAGIVTSLVLGPYTLYRTLLQPRQVFRAMHGRMTETEIAFLTDGARDPLARDYFALVAATMHLPPMSQPDVHTGVREALRALGRTLESLPPHVAGTGEEDPAALEQDAQRLAQEVARENDPVIAASLERRIDSLQQRAETAERAAILTRRNQALRHEIAEQMAALRTSLAAAGIGEGDSDPLLTSMAASIRRVATEAGALADAHTELAMTLTPHRRIVAPPDTEEVSAHRQ